MLVDGVGDLGEPRAVFAQFQNIRSGKKFDPVRWRIAKRLYQLGRNEDWHVMPLAAEHPACLFHRKAGGQLTQERQKPMLFIFHAHRTHQWPKTEQEFLRPTGLRMLRKMEG